MSTAYSGRTAINASSAIASACGISNWASSAAQESMNAAPKIDKPALRDCHSGEGCVPDRCITIHWRQRKADEPIQSQFVIRFSPCSPVDYDLITVLFPQPMADVNAKKKGGR